MSSTPDASALSVDLWPKARFETDAITPLSILRRQAALLGEKTQQLVTAEVSTRAHSDQMTHTFRLVVPALDNYKYELFSVQHKIDQLYPVTGYAASLYANLDDQAAFVDWLRQVLSSEPTLKKLDSLMAQAKG
jgi:hypothetical protein